MKRLVKMLDRSADVVRELGSQAQRIALDVADVIERAAHAIAEHRAMRPRDPTASCALCEDTGLIEDGWCEGEPCLCPMGTVRALRGESLAKEST